MTVTTDAVLVLSFEPPGPYLNANDRAHHMARSRDVATWAEAAYYYTCRELPGGPEARRLPPGRYRVEAILPVKGARRRDPSNWHPTIKAIIDGMTRANVWPDDSAEYVTVAEPVLSTATTEVVIAVVPCP